MSNILLNLFIPGWSFGGEFIGSRAIGMPTSKTADWDYMFPLVKKEEILKNLRDRDIFHYTNLANGSIKFTLDFDDQELRSILKVTSTTFNFSFIDEQNYEPWKKVTEVMKICYQLGGIPSSKKNRIDMFCKFVVLFGGTTSIYPNYCS
jgi:hypothetical protein